ncbi:hypothetical protein Btru_071604 [Bulinus truncatus]|nr:hypothetical protein Btru_071604 [Bulinus truncatus]
MAFSLAQFLRSNLNRYFKKIYRINNRSFKLNEKSRLYTAFKFSSNSNSDSLRGDVIIGMSYGVTLALFGLNLNKKGEDDILTQKYRDARLAHMRQDLKKADDLYHECLKLASQLVESKDITEEKFLTARTLMYDGLADIAMQTGQLETAELLYKDTMKGCLQQLFSMLFIYFLLTKMCLFTRRIFEPVVNKSIERPNKTINIYTEQC